MRVDKSLLTTPGQANYSYPMYKCLGLPLVYESTVGAIGVLLTKGLFAVQNRGCLFTRQNEKRDNCVKQNMTS